MFENIMKFFRKLSKKEEKVVANSKDAAKERLHLVLMQDRANVSADFLELMKQEIIEVIKKYIDVDESAIDVRLTNKENEDGSNGAPALYANIPILNIKNDSRKINKKENNKENEEENRDKDTDIKEDEAKNNKKAINNEIEKSEKEQENNIIIDKTKKEDEENKEDKKDDKEEIKNENKKLKEKDKLKKDSKEEVKSENK